MRCHSVATVATMTPSAVALPPMNRPIEDGVEDGHRDVDHGAILAGKRVAAPEA